MPRKTVAGAEWVETEQGASMRPRPDAAENLTDWDPPWVRPYLLQ